MATASSFLAPAPLPATGRRFPGRWALLGTGLLLLATLALQHWLDPWLSQRLVQGVSRATQGAYQLRLGSVRTHLWSRSLDLDKAELVPTPNWPGAWPATLPRARLTVGHIRLSGVGVLALLRHGVVPVDSLVLEAVRVDYAAGPRQASAQDVALYQQLPAHLAGVRVGVVRLRQLRGRYAWASQTRLTATQASVVAHDVLVSAKGAADPQRTAYAADWTGTLRGATVHAPDYTGQLAQAHVATHAGHLDLDSLRLDLRGGQRTHLWLPRLRLRGWQTAAWQHQQQFQADTLTVEAPRLEMPFSTGPSSPLHVQLAPYLRSAQLTSLRVHAGRLLLTSAGLSPTIEGLNLRATQLRVDAAAARDPQRVAYARAWQVSSGRLAARFDDPFYRLACQGIRLDTRRQTVRLAGVVIAPMVSAAELNRRKGEQSSHVFLRLPLVQAHGVDFGRLLARRELRVQTLVAEQPWLRLTSGGERVPLSPLPSMFTPLAVRRLPLLLSFQTVQVHDGIIGTPYHSRVEGHFLLSHFTGTLHNFSNDPRLMTAKHPFTGTVHARLQDRCAVQLSVRVPLLDPQGRHQLAGTIGPMPVTLLNPMLGPTQTLTFARGQLQQVRFQLAADLYQADGAMVARYSDLHIGFIKRSANKATIPLLTRLKSGAVDGVLIRNQNPRPSGRLVAGRLRSKRDPRFAVFVLWQQALVSGLLNSAGVPQKLAQKVSEGSD